MKIRVSWVGQSTTLIQEFDKSKVEIRQIWIQLKWKISSRQSQDDQHLPGDLQLNRRRRRLPVSGACQRRGAQGAHHLHRQQRLRWLRRHNLPLQLPVDGWNHPWRRGFTQCWTILNFANTRLWSLLRLPWCCWRWRETSWGSLGGFFSFLIIIIHNWFKVFCMVVIFYQGEHHQWIVGGMPDGQFQRSENIICQSLQPCFHFLARSEINYDFYVFATSHFCFGLNIQTATPLLGECCLENLTFGTFPNPCKNTFGHE